jgi:pimeloyl-ACP methyl ester carboxylesterase
MTKRKRLLAAAIGLLVLFFVVTGIPAIRDRIFPWTVRQVLAKTLYTYPPWGFSVTKVQPGQEVYVETGDGRRLPADYFPARPPRRGRILFVHGSIPKGRRFTPYRFLARRFSERGYDVLLPDIGGFGDALLEPEAVPTFGADVAAAARTLHTLSGDRDPASFLVIAHSLGASMALEAVLQHELRPGRLVIWDPPLGGEIRRVSLARPQGLDRFRSELQVKGGGLSRAADQALLDYMVTLDPLDQIPRLPRPRPRTLAPLGSLVNDHRTLTHTAGSNATWLTVLDLVGVDHFLDMVALGQTGSWILYRPGNCRLFMDSVLSWVDLNAPPRAGKDRSTSPARSVP